MNLINTFKLHQFSSNLWQFCYNFNGPKISNSYKVPIILVNVLFVNKTKENKFRKILKITLNAFINKKSTAVFSQKLLS